MLKTFEPGDVVEVEDNVEAGVFAGCTVKLISKSTAHGFWWLVEFVNCTTSKGSLPETAYTHQDYFQ